MNQWKHEWHKIKSDSGSGGPLKKKKKNNTVIETKGPLTLRITNIK